MKLNLKLAQRLILGVTPLVTATVFAALPSFAATLASSEAALNIHNFSHNPLRMETQKSPDPSENTNDDQVVSRSKAEAFFSINRSNPSGTTASSSSVSVVNGDGSGYSERAQSSATVVGYNFLVEAGQTFSFDFSGLLGLNTSVDYEPEAANAFGTVAFQLFDSNDLNNPLDFFTIAGSLNSLDNSDFLSDFMRSSHITLNPNETTYTTYFGTNKEAAKTNFTGRFSRFFDQTTTLVLREFKSTSSGASCPSR